MRTSGIIQTFLIHAVWQMQASYAPLHRYARGDTVYQIFELSVFKMTKWCGIPRIVIASVNIAGIAKFLVPLI